MAANPDEASTSAATQGIVFINMKRLIFCLTAMLTVAACQERVETTPAEVTAQIREFAAEQCGVPSDQPNFQPGYLEVIDLSHDKRPDFVVDYAAIRCGGETSLLCEGDGCRREIYVSDGRGGYGLAYGRTARGFELDLEQAPPVITATLAGEACRKAPGVQPSSPTPVCEKRFVFDPIQLVFIEKPRGGQATEKPAGPTPPED